MNPAMLKRRKRSEAEYQKTKADIAEMKIAEANINWAASAAALANIMNMIDEKERNEQL